MIMIGEIVVLLEELTYDFWFYTTSTFSFKKDAGETFQLCIELKDTNLKNRKAPAIPGEKTRNNKK